MNRSPFLVLFISLSFFTSFVAIAQLQPKHELRGAWIATYSNIDWPDRKATPEMQRQAFIQLMDQHKATGINAVYVQVRSQSDAMYPSEIEPWSADLTGIQGLPPSPLWDPLKFMIEESGKRGIEFHAWINPYRVAGHASSIASFSSKHVAKQHPEWLLRSGTKVTLDPGLPAVRDHIIKVIKDIVDRYDVDGIHFDDYFYPEAGFNDDASYNKDSRGISSRADWRRDNVNLLIERAYKEIKELKPWVKFGVSPSGIYRNSSDPALGSATAGMEHYNALYADSRRWLQEGWVDYIEPQVYWYTGQPGADYNKVVPWWNDNSYGRHVYIGMGTYKVDKWSRLPWGSVSQIPDQIRLNRSFINRNVQGQAFYNSSSMSLNLLGFRDSLRSDLFRTPALLPKMPWRDSIAPLPPASLTVSSFGKDSVVLNWSKSPVVVTELDKVKQYVIYRSVSPLIDLNDPVNILVITRDTSAFRDTAIIPDVTYYYAVSALDRLHNESELSNTAATGKTSVLPGLIAFSVKQADEKHVMLNWTTMQEKGIKEFALQKSADGTDFTFLRNIPAYGDEQFHEYSVTDSITGYNKPFYYRIKVLDSLGNEKNTRLLAHTINKDQEIAIVRQIPGNDFRLIMLISGEVEYTIYDEDRKRVTWGKIRPFPVRSQVVVTGTKELVPGTYVINLKFGTSVQNIRLIIP